MRAACGALAALVAILPFAEAYPVGAGRCSGPGGPHGSASVWTGTDTPVVIVPSSTTVRAGEVVTFVLSGSYKGFLLKSSSGSDSWLALGSDVQAASVCPASTPAVTHRSSALKTDLAFQWASFTPGTTTISGFVVVSVARW